MARYVNLDNPKIFKAGRDKFGNALYAIPVDTPCENVRQVALGEWNMDNADNEDLSGVECSVCGEMFLTNGKYNWRRLVAGWKFCPNCGAEMMEHP